MFLLTSNVFPGMLDFRDYTLLSYGNNQDLSGTAVVDDNGAALHLTGNVWKCIAYDYLITPDTVLEFDFQSNAQGEEHSIGLDKDLGNTPDNRFKLYGTQNSGAALLDYNDYLSYSPQTRHYEIPIGQYYTGAMLYLFFVNDHDAGSMNAQSRFTNVNIYEKELSPAPSPDPMTWQIPPHPTNDRSISMTATTAYDPDGVEYYFRCLSNSDHDSGWQESPAYVATDLRLNTEYVFTVRARDKSSDKNETAPSLPASVVTPSFVILDDFEVYYGNSRYADDPFDGNHLLANNWKDGTTNATGSLILPYPVGYLEVTFDNSAPPHYSTIQRQWQTPQNWKIEDLQVLSLLFKGDPNVPSLYVRLYDDTGFADQKVTGANELHDENWHQLNFDLSLFEGLAEILA